MDNDRIFSRISDFVGGAHQTRRTADDVVCGAQIRRWTEAFGDENPIYRDDRAALAAGRSGIVAPPAMLGVFTARGLRETRMPSNAGGLSAALSELGFITPGTGIAHSYENDIFLGDRLYEIMQTETVSVRKTTKLGSGYFITYRSDFYNQQDVRVGVQRITVFAFQPGVVDADCSESAAREAQKAEVGQPLPPLSLTLDRLGIIACTTACSDFNAPHYDPDSARSLGFEDIFTDIYTAMGFAQRFLTDRSSDADRLSAIELRLGVPLYAGDTLHLEGDRRRDNNDAWAVRFKGLCSKGVHLSGTAKITNRKHC